MIKASQRILIVTPMSQQGSVPSEQPIHSLKHYLTICDKSSIRFYDRMSLNSFFFFFFKKNNKDSINEPVFQYTPLKSSSEKNLRCICTVRYRTVQHKKYHLYVYTFTVRTYVRTYVGVVF